MVASFAVCGGATAQVAGSAESQSLDEFDGITAWKVLVSDGATASLREERGVRGGALMLEFDFAKAAGYVGARRALPVTLPEDYEITFWLHGVPGRNDLQVKFVDASGDNVWWFRRPDFVFSGEWQRLRVKRRQIEFAWGPTTDRTLRHFDSIEFVVAAGADGGRGQFSIDQLALQPLEAQGPIAQPTARATSEYGDYTAMMILDGSSDTAWRSNPSSAGPQIVDIDFQRVREFGGIEIVWAPGLSVSKYQVALSNDARDWKIVRSVTEGNGGRDSLLLPESEARYLRLTIPTSARGVGIAELRLRDIDFGASPDVFTRSLAHDARRGCYPRAYTGEQTYWTTVGTDGGNDESLLSEDGAIEPRKGSFSIEPALRTPDGWLTWADVEISQSLADGYLPLPSVHWRHSGVTLDVTAYASGTAEKAQTSVVYRVHNAAGRTQRFTLALLLRPYQVNPPSQFLNTAGGVSYVHELSFQGGAVRVDRHPRVFPRIRPSAFHAASLDAGPPCEWLTRPGIVSATRDEAGFASGALLFDLTLAAGASREVVVDLPLAADAPVSTADLMDQSAARWRAQLNRVEISVPPDSQAIVDTLRTATAHVLINRDGLALQPGSRSYARSWIRDGAMTAEMLLRLGQDEAVIQFLRWYAGYQFANGKVPCCVDRRGADAVPENDSNGEFLSLVDETYLYTMNREVLQEMWPAVVRAVNYLESLRLSERSPENLTADRQAFYGLLPASISHEGYAAKAVHSYWDDFWGLNGYESAVRIARALGQRDEMHRWITARDQFRSDVYRSLRITMNAHRIDYLPGSAELGDFDPTSTTIAVAPLGELHMLPPLPTEATFERYWRDFSGRRASTAWDVYTPYEWRNVGAFVRLGWRERLWELIPFFMQGRRPASWNQWAEVVGREPRQSRFIGDMPHGWVGSDYGRAVLDLFAFERPFDESLVLMAGIPREWTRRDGFGVRALRTPYGPLSFSLRIEGDRRVLNVEGIKLPRGGVAIAWPPGDRPTRQTIRRGAARWIDEELRISQLPFTIDFPD